MTTAHKDYKTPRVQELAWAAGLFEGEGCFTSADGYPRAQLKMTDEEPVRRFCVAVGLGHVTGPHDAGPGRKPNWLHVVHGFERVQQLMALLWYGLGPRRRGRASEILRTARVFGGELRGRSWYGPNRGTASHCHNGHAYTSANSYYRPSDGLRECRLCRRDASRRLRARRRAA